MKYKRGDRTEVTLKGEPIVSDWWNTEIYMDTEFAKMKDGSLIEILTLDELLDQIYLETGVKILPISDTEK